MCFLFFFFKQKTAYEMRISDWSSDVCSSDLDHIYFQGAPYFDPAHPENYFITGSTPSNSDKMATIWGIEAQAERRFNFLPGALSGLGIYANYTFTKSKRGQIYNWPYGAPGEEVYEFSGISFNNQPKHSGTVALRSEEHTSELQSLMRNSYAV